ncbi:hypothetical protein FHL15_000972 [Xylaria flabelliformis]|uniref:Protein kinase domain-containing protein n=1 Tax=Xylaria flabelliformis TaxID=2512241 RepID=A0A553IDQ0_9PEZI|nr:hypothetical protein FHL15_000972 [Xylaria flabelliformis]
MAAPTNASPPLSLDSNRLAALWKRFTGKGTRGLSPPGPRSEPGLSRDSSVSSGVVRRVSRKVVPGLPRVKTFRRQQSENREKLEAVLPTQAERRAVSVDRRMLVQRSASHSSQILPRASAPDLFEDTPLSAGKLDILSHTASAPHSPVDENHFLSLNGIQAPSIMGGDDHPGEHAPNHPEAISTADAQSIDTTQYDALVRDELEHKWILNLSMHFRDKSRREKFFVTYREKDSIWRRVTISLDYRNAPSDSLEKDLLSTKFQRDKSAKIYEAIRESLQDIQFYDTVTNLKLQTAEGRLHVHVVEDVNEIIHFPTVRMVEHMDCRRIRESELEFDSHMSGFVYKVRVDGHTLIKKEIPGPDTIDEFLYEVNALNSLRFSKSIIEFFGVVVDDEDQVVKGLLISYAEKGALIDVIYDAQEHGHQGLPWAIREKWARQIVQGLSDIHETGFVQGDFTLSNIVIDDFGNAKIIDINRRGCPVGWEPPEATPLIDSSQRISMYIGVKSDLYQLGMVLWALATLEDEPEGHPRPLRLNPELQVPSWYRGVVENCLHENPRVRSQATALLARFPETPYDDAHEDRGLQSTSVHDGTSFRKYAEGEDCGLPEIRTVEPRNSWPYSASNTQSTSPSLSDEPYPRRGRSPPSPLPTHHDLYTSPYVSGNAMWTKMHDIAAVDDDPTADEALDGTPRDLHDTTEFAMKMEEELDQIEANLQAEAILEDEQPQAPGGNSPAQGISLQTVVEPPAMVDGLVENIISLDEDEATVLTPTHIPTPGGTSNETPDAVELETDKSTESETISNNSEVTENIPQHDIDNTTPPLDFQTMIATTPPDIDNPAKSTETAEPQDIETQIDIQSTAYKNDRTCDQTEDISTRPTEATASDLVSQKDTLPAEPSEQASVGLAHENAREQSPSSCPDECPSAPVTEAVRDAEVSA